MTEFTLTEDFPKSQVEFDARFNNEKACQDYLFNMKWPDGFECRKCRHKEYWVTDRGLYLCTRCEIAHSLTAGTVMHGTQKPITYWLLLEFQRSLAAWSVAFPTSQSGC